MKRAGFICDAHIPCEDPRAYELALDILQDIKVDCLILGGDWSDFYSLNQYGVSPDVQFNLEEERYAVRKRLREMRKAFKDVEIIYLQGNHEYRLERFVDKYAPQFFNMITTDKFFNLGEFDIKYIPYGHDQKHNVLGTPLIARHEPLSCSLHCAYQTVIKGARSMIFGHTHRIQSVILKNIDGQHLKGTSCGCLLDFDSPVFKYRKGVDSWAHGFNIITVLDDGIWFSEQIHILPRGRKYCALVDGCLYEN